MKPSLLAGSLLFLSAFLFGQSNADPVLDSLKRPLPAGATARAQAERVQSILWRIFRMEEEGFEDYPRQLDSLYECCLAAKTGDKRFEKTVAADAVFFKSCQLLNGQPQAAKPLFETAIRQFRNLGDSTKTAYGFMEMCSLESNQGDSIAFSTYMEQALALLPHIGDPYSQAQILCDIGIGCYDFGRYAEAAAHYFASLKIIETCKTPDLLTLQPDIYYNLCGVYRRIGDGNNSLIYIKKAIESAKENHLDTLAFFTPLSWALMWKNDFRGALRVLKQSEGASPWGQAVSRLGENAYVQANCYRNLGVLDSALLYARKSVEFLPISSNSTYGAHALLELANCEFELGKEGALQKALTAFETFSASKSNQGFLFTTELLVKIYKSRGDYRKALEYSELRFSYQAQAERQQSARQLAFGEFTRDNEVKNARREADIQAQLTRQRNIRYALFAGLGVLALIALLLYNRYRFKQRSAEQLESKNREVEAARLRAERSEAFKSRFLANMSHEIRTPLHGIAGFTDLLLDTALSEKQRRWLLSIQHSTDRLGEVVNDILDLSKLEAGEVKLRQVPFSPARVAADVRDALARRAENQGINLTLDIGENVPEALRGDPTRLYQILMNLAGNAVKFTEKGEVRLALEGGQWTANDAPQPSTAYRIPSTVFTITDTGIGIPSDKLATIFESFQQASDDTTARFGGTGLGLSIARELVQLYGSDIQVESTLGKGSIFSFTLMLPLANAADLALETPTADALQFTQPLNILLADDNALNREIAEEALHRHFEQAAITEAANGKAVLEWMQKQAFDLILMDLQMPEMNGMEATRYIRQHISKAIPIIALTASATPEEIERALAAGMNRHLGKPFKPRELARVIAGLLGLEGDRSGEHGASPNLPGLQDLEDFDLRFLRDFCAGDEAQMRHFINKFNTQWPLELERLAGALRMEDRTALYQAAHSFRPQLEFVGLQKLGDLVWRLEQGARGNRAFGELAALLEQTTAALQRLRVDQ